MIPQMIPATLRRCHAADTGSLRLSSGLPPSPLPLGCVISTAFPVDTQSSQFP
jgi:hypothetical protein